MTFLLAGLSLPLQAAQEVAQQFAFEGRLYQVDGATPLTDTVNFKFQILNQNTSGNPINDCVLYEEVQNGVNLNPTAGVFSVTIGSGVGATKRTANDGALTMAQIFDNSKAITAPVGQCAITPYTPSAGSVRRLRVTVTNTATGISEVMNPDLAIGSVPQALVAETLQGLSPTDFLKVDGTSVMSDALNFDNWTTAGRPSSPAVGATGFNTTTGYLESWNGSTWVDYSAGSGGGSLSGLTSGRVVLSTGSTSASDSANLTFNSTTGAVGIGGTSPAISTSAGSLSLNPSSGFVGINTASPAHSLDIQGGSIRIDAGSGNSNATINLVGRNGGAANATSIFADWPGALNYDAAAHSFKVSGTAKVVMLGNGTVGIGTTTPSSVLDVSGTNAGGTLRIFDQTATTGITRGVIRAGAGQTTTNLLEFQNNVGTNLSYVNSGGYFYQPGTPTAATNQAATTSYVDSAISGVGGAAVTKDGLTPLTGDWDVSGAGSRSLTNIAKIAVGSSTLPTGGVAHFNGNVGIGTASPIAPLDVNGAIEFKSNVRSRIGATNTYYFDIAQSSNSTTIRGGHINPLILTHRADLSNVNGAVSENAVVTTSGTLGGSDPTNSVIGLKVAPTVNQSGAGRFIGLMVNPTLTSTGSGSKILAWIGSGGTSNFVIDSAGNVGIGTTSPVSKLHVGAAPSASANYGLLSLGSGAFDGATAGYFGTSSSSSSNGTVIAVNEVSGYSGDLMNLQVAGASKFKVDKDGKIYGDGSTLTGVSGTVSGLTATRIPYAASSTSLTDNTNFTFTSGSSTVSAWHFDATAGSSTYKIIGSSVMGRNSGTNALEIGNNSWVQPITFTTTAGEVARINQAGNFGLGTTTPTSKIHVATDPTASANYGLISLGGGAFDGSTAGFFTGSGSGNVIAVNAASGFSGRLMELQIAGSSKFRVNSSGISSFNDATSNAGAGYGFKWTSGAGFGAGYGLTGFVPELNGAYVGDSFNKNITGIGHGRYALNFVGAGTSTLLGVGLDASNNAIIGAATNLDFQTGSTSRLYINSSGNVGVGTINPGALLQLGTPGASLGTMRLTGNTSGYVQIQPAAAAGSWTMTLPPDAGTSGYVLRTDGAGVTSWVAQSGGASSGTSGHIQFSNGSSGFSSDSNKLFWDATNDRLGIGTSSPAYALDVSSAAQIKDKLILSSLDGNEGIFGWDAQDEGVSKIFSLTRSDSDHVNNVKLFSIRDLSIKTNGDETTEKFRVTAAGNVGIGTASPSEKLHVSGNIIIPSGSTLKSVTGGDLIGFNGSTVNLSPGNYDWQIGHATDTNQVPRILSSGAYGSKTLTFSMNGSDRLKIDASGNVGIGTTSPGALLQVGTAGTSLGTMRLTGNTSGYVQIQPAAAAGSYNFTLPPNGGTNGYVLQTDGSGTTSWVAQSGGASNGVSGAVQFSGGSGAFSSNAASFFWDNTNAALGIGSNNPNGNSAKLFVDTSAMVNAVSGKSSMAYGVRGETGSSLAGVLGISTSNGAGVQGGSAAGYSGFFRHTVTDGSNTLGTLVARQASSQTSDILQIQDSSANNLFRVTASGHPTLGYQKQLTFTSASYSNAYITNFDQGYGSSNLILINGTNCSTGAGSNFCPTGFVGDNTIFTGWNYSAYGAESVLNIGAGGNNKANLISVNNNYYIPTVGLESNILFDALRTSGGHTQFAKIGMVTTDVGNTTYAGDLAFSTSNAAAPAERMRITSAGKVGIGDATPDTTLKVTGSLCVKSDGNNCAGSTAGTIYANTTTVQSADYAEYFLAEEEALPGSVIGLNPKTGLARKYRAGDKLLGIVSTSPGVVGNSDIKDKKSILVALMGQVPFNSQEVVVLNNEVFTKDQQPLGYVLANGHVYVNVGSTSVKREIQSMKNENAMMKSYLCAKDPQAPFCK